MRHLFSFLIVFAGAISFHGDVLADGPAPIVDSSPLKLKNVELSVEGGLIGQYVNANGEPVSGVKITVLMGKTKVDATTDEQGRFQVLNLKGGRCILQVGENTYACQVWAHGTAPPGSISTLSMVADVGESAVLGNGYGSGRLLAPLSRGGIIKLGLLTGVAVGVSVAVSDTNNDASN